MGIFALGRVSAVIDRMLVVFVVVLIGLLAALVAGLPDAHPADRVYGVPSTVMVFSLVSSLVTGAVALVLHTVFEARIGRPASPSGKDATNAVGMWLVAAVAAGIVLTLGTASSY
jgi:hypothetical protein